MQQHDDYKIIIKKFLDRKIPTNDFVDLYLTKFKEEKNVLDDRTFDLLDWLFAEIDSYTDDDNAVRDDPENYIDENQLRHSAAKVLEELRVS